MSWAGSPLVRGVPQQPVYRGTTDVVSIDVSVERRNRPVTGLTAADFELRDNGVAQTIELVAGDSTPLDVTLVVDQSSVGQISFGGRFWDDIRSVARHLRPADRLRVIRFATDVVEEVPMRAVGDVNSNPILPFGRADSDPLARRWSSGSGHDYVHDPKLNMHSASDALLLALARPADEGRRHLVLAFLFGQDDGSVLYLGGLIPEVAARSDALLHIGLWHKTRADWGDPFVFTHLRGEFAAAAEATGGRQHAATNLVGTSRDVIENLRKSYVLRYTLTGVAPGGWHRVEVRLPRHADYKVRARRGYVGR